MFVNVYIGVYMYIHMYIYIYSNYFENENGASFTEMSIHSLSTNTAFREGRTTSDIYIDHLGTNPNRLLQALCIYYHQPLTTL